LGMNYFIPQIFDEKNWSSHTVFSDTRKQLENFQISYDVMITLRDVDRESDLDILKLDHDFFLKRVE